MTESPAARVAVEYNTIANTYRVVVRDDQWIYSNVDAGLGRTRDWLRADDPLSYPAALERAAAYREQVERYAARWREDPQAVLARQCTPW